MSLKHTIRAKSGGTVDVVLTRDTAIKAHCTACLGYEDHPNACTRRTCELFPYRGKTTLAFHADDPASVKVEKQHVEGVS